MACCPHGGAAEQSPRSGVQIEAGNVYCIGEHDLPLANSMGPLVADDMLLGILECVRSIRVQHQHQHQEVVALLEAVQSGVASGGRGTKLPEPTGSTNGPAPATSSAPAAEGKAVDPEQRAVTENVAVVACTPRDARGITFADSEIPEAVVETDSPDVPVVSVEMPAPRRPNLQTSSQHHAKRLSPLDFAFGEEFKVEVVVIPPLSDGFGPFIRAVCRFGIRWRYFDHFIGFVILVNSIIIGFEAAEEVHGRSYGFIGFIEPSFLCIYVIELLMRLVSDGLRENILQPWVRFDIFLVGLGTISMAVVEPIKQMSQQQSTQGSDSVALDALEWIMILRIMRLLRLLRALRLLSQFKQLWTLVQGLLSSGSTMLSTMAVLFFVIYVFACIGVELITKQEHSNPDIQKLVESNFATLPGVMLTLTQFVTLDSIAGIYSPFIFDNWYLIFYFLPLILIVPVALMNVVTAVIVESALAMAADDVEMNKKYMMQYLRRVTPEIHDAFKLVDADSSGIITKDEIENAAQHLPAAFMEKLKDGDVVEFFETLDVDGSGEITEEEFVNGIMHFLMSNVSVETQQTLKMLRIIKEKLVLLEEVVFQLPGAPPLKSAHSFHQFDKKKTPTLSRIFGASASRHDL